MENLGKALDLHKRLTKANVVHLRRRDKVLHITSASPSGLTVRNNLTCEGADFDEVVDMLALAAFARGAADLSLEVKDSRLYAKGKRLKGDIPTLNEDRPEVSKSAVQEVATADVVWLCENLSRVQISDLDRTGLLSAACDGKRWSVMCADDVHGACLFGDGESKIAFSLLPSDAEYLRVVLDTTRSIPGATFIGCGEGKLSVRAKGLTAIIPTVEGSPQEEKKVVAGYQAVAKFAGADLRESLSVLAPVASAKDAAPVSIKIDKSGITLGASSPTGTMQHLLAAQVGTSCEFRASHPLLSALAARTEESVKLCTLSENHEVTRIMLRCGDLMLVMLTSS